MLNTLFDDPVEEKQGRCALMCIRHVYVVRNTYTAVRSVSSFFPFKAVNSVHPKISLFSDIFAYRRPFYTSITSGLTNPSFFECEKSKFCFGLYSLLRTDENVTKAG